MIASRIGGLPDLVEDGQTGLLFSPGDSAALAACMRNLRVSQELARELAVNGLRKAQDQLSPRRHLEQLLRVYGDAVMARK